MREDGITTYKAFWPFYVSQHQNKMNRNLHFAGTMLVFTF
ncbi:MAG: Mpo1-like protein, partial [Bdellovibrionota bacterium]